MKITNNKYFLRLITFLGMFLCIANVNAKEITCKYNIESDSIPYNTLTVVYSDDGSEIEIQNKEALEYKYVAYYQFDSGTKNALYSGYADSEKVSLWTQGEASNSYMSFISINTWINEECLENIDILYNDDKTAFGFSASATANQSKFNHMNHSITASLSYNSEKGQVYEVTVSANGSKYWKVYRVYSGELIPEPLSTETGLSETQDGKELCWQTQKGKCWDFDTPVTSDLDLNAVYINRSNSSAGFIDNLDKKYVNCAGIELPYGVPYFIHKIIDLIKIVTPIILIVLGMLDFGKAVVANDEKNMKEASSKFIRRALAAVIIFFVVAIVQFVFNQVVSDNKGAMGCINCFINDDCNPYEK